MNKFVCCLAMLLSIICLAREVECRSRTKRGFPEIPEYVTAHNMFRKKEKAANMNKLVWDEVLAEMADIWAKGCNFKHGQPPSPTSPDYDDVGQNLYASSSKNLDSLNKTSVVNSWYAEIAYYTFDTQACVAGKMCGHYTQVVWADTAHVGCAAAYCSTLKSVSWTSGILVVCNYGPPGNYVGEDPYVKGEPCSSCTTCEDGLCLS